jgi:hypothetical protein
MNEAQVMLAEKIRAFMQTLRSSGMIISGQATFRHVRPNTASMEYDTEVIVTNRDGEYIFDVHTLGTPSLEEWSNLEVSSEERQANTEARSPKSGQEKEA